MSYEYEQPTRAELEQAEAEAMVRPDPCSMFDERLYTTHAPVIDWAVNSGDHAAESNYTLITQHLIEVAGPDDRAVIEGTMSDWLVGPLKQTFVQVRDDEGTFTRVWMEAVAIALYLRDCYPLFDEDDVSAREFDAWTNQVDQEMEYATSDFVDVDGADLHTKLCYVAIGDLQEAGSVDYLGCPDRAELVEAYAKARDTYYGDLALEQMQAQIPGQGALL